MSHSQQDGKENQCWHLDVPSRDLELHSMYLRNQTWWLWLSRSERTLGERSQEVHQRCLLFPSSSQERRLWQSHAWVLEIREGIVILTLHVVQIKTNFYYFLSLQIHVNLMIAEARMQAALLYALRAVMRFMTWRRRRRERRRRRGRERKKKKKEEEEEEGLFFVIVIINTTWSLTSNLPDKEINHLFCVWSMPWEGSL